MNKNELKKAIEKSKADMFDMLVRTAMDSESDEIDVFVKILNFSVAVEVISKNLGV